VNKRNRNESEPTHTNFHVRSLSQPKIKRITV